MDLPINEVLRNKINEDYFIYNHFANVDGKDKWSKICSCMDWLDAYSKVYSSFEINETADINVGAFQYYSLIMVIDVIRNSINELYMTLSGERKVPQKWDAFKLLKEDVVDDEFKVKEMDDDSLFSHIRAVFGAHSNNLNLNGSRYFASWPGKGIFNKYDLHVRVWKNTPDEPGFSFGIFEKDLRDYIENKFLEIHEIINLIDEMKHKWNSELSSNQIPDTDDIYEEILLLKKESITRLSPVEGSNFYTDELDRYQMILESHDYIDTNYLSVYDSVKKVIIQNIETIRQNLQLMQDDELTDIKKYINSDIDLSDRDSMFHYYSEKGHRYITYHRDGCDQDPFYYEMYLNYCNEISKLLEIKQFHDLDIEIVKRIDSFYRLLM